ncbi:hypothetical protein E4U13_008216 [Claviceps humidiphila]|uniref:DUF7371 domain-containing protein n=1 Tax=Claviceps humidiphila TaxID=1294629 RepID=A0A9P7Q3L4_9HYPO|nr:hypothetical protein E4U13_008216 [Claviceps humidiphila]
MRASLSFGAIVASRLLHAAAQATYSDEVANGHSAGPQQSPKGTVTTGGGISSGPNGQVCSMQDTTTLFITVYPTTPNPNGEGSSAEATGPDGTVYTTVYPTRTIEVSPVNSAPGDNPSAQVFTTLTVTDLWVGSSASVSSSASPVSGSDSSLTTSGSVSDGASTAAPTTYESAISPSESKPVESTSAVDAVGTSAGTTNSAVTYSASDNVITATVTQGTANANGDGEIFTTVTDTVVEWATGSDGSSPVTVLSAHTMTVAPSGAQATSGSSPLITCWTVTGSDGKETVVESTVVTNQDNSGIQNPTTVATVTSGSLDAQSVTSNLPQQTPVTTITAGGSVPVYTGTGMTTATVITILGSDGVPTVVHSTWVLQTGPVTAAASGVLPAESTISTQEAQGHGVTGQTTYTVVGPDGRPTVVESILVIPVSVVLATELPQNLPNGITVQATPSSASETLVSGFEVPGATVTCSSYTLLGSDGKLTVVETTYLVSGPTGTSGVSGISPGVVTGIPSQITAGPSQVVPPQVSPQALTTCITYTVIGTDGLSTVVESTIAMPSSNLVPTGSVFEIPSAVSPTLTNALPQGTQLNPQGGQPIVTCVTVDIVGPNGIVTPVVETIVLTAPASVQVSAAIPAATIGLPSVVSQILSDLPQGVTPSSTAAIPMTTTLTIPVVGSDGVTSSLVQTVVYNFPDPSSGFHPFTAGEVPGTGSTISSSLQVYGSGVSPVLTALPPPPPVVLTATSGMLPAGTNVVPSVPVLTVVTGLDGMTGLSVVTAIPATAYNNPANSGVNGLPASELSAASLNPNNYAFSQQAAATAVLPQTSTWVNVIPEPTTTRTLKFPLTTLTTVFVPAKASVVNRGVLRRARQAILPPFLLSQTLGPSTSFNVPAPAPTLPVPVMSVSPSDPAMCPAASKVGNHTLNFDTHPPGPLFNPSGDLWFSEGFLISPLLPQAVQGYMPSSGSQLVEFVPPALTSQQSSDTAEIGVGPNAPNPCFRFNLYGANLGCAARAAEQWCEFHISAYTYNQAAANEMSIAWSEVKRVPACPSFPNAPCPLTPVALEGYQNITSVLIEVRVGLDLRTWWADDFSYGWTDNSCAAAQCREATAPQHVKREVVESAVRRGVWSWTPAGLRKLDDESVRGSAA